MSNSTALFACSKCFKRYPFEELSSGQQLCKECRGTCPVVKCKYCRSEFQQTNKNASSTICGKCEHNVKHYGKPSACEYCNIIAAFIGNKCQRCTNSEKKYGPPVACEHCKQKCAFDRKEDDDKKVDGKLLCWLCTLSFKRALAKTKQPDGDRRSHMKVAAQKSNNNNKTKDPKLIKPRTPNNKRSQRSDGSMLPANNDANDKDGFGLPGSQPPLKLPRTGNHIHDTIDPHSSDHLVAMTQLKEQMASLKKQLAQKDSVILSKDKMITELKAIHFTAENELKSKMNKNQREYETKVEMMSSKIKQLNKDIAGLSKCKNNKRNNHLTSAASGGGSGSGTDSPSIT